MDSWFIKDRKDAWKEIYKKTIGRDHFSPVDDFVVAGFIWEVIDDINKWDEVKRIRDREEQIKQHYNVYVYRVMPYPPNTKDKKDTVCK